MRRVAHNDRLDPRGPRGALRRIGHPDRVEPHPSLRPMRRVAHPDRLDPRRALRRIGHPDRIDPHGLHGPDEPIGRVRCVDRVDRVGSYGPLSGLGRVDHGDPVGSPSRRGPGDRRGHQGRPGGVGGRPGGRRRTGPRRPGGRDRRADRETGDDQQRGLPGQHGDGQRQPGRGPPPVPGVPQPGEHRGPGDRLGEVPAQRDRHTGREREQQAACRVPPRVDRQPAAVPRRDQQRCRVDQHQGECGGHAGQQRQRPGEHRGGDALLPVRRVVQPHAVLGRLGRPRVDREPVDELAVVATRLGHHLEPVRRPSRVHEPVAGHRETAQRGRERQPHQDEAEHQQAGQPSGGGHRAARQGGPNRGRRCQHGTRGYRAPRRPARRHTGRGPPHTGPGPDAGPVAGGGQDAGTPTRRG